MTPTKQQAGEGLILRAIPVPALDCALVPVAIKQRWDIAEHQFTAWNGRVHRWHRRGGQ